jgi:hypothetical protein
MNNKKKWTGSAIKIPESVAMCPECGASVYADIFEVGLDDGATEWTVAGDGSGMHLQCEDEDDNHYGSPYIDWMPLDAPVARWLNDNYDFAPRQVTPRTNETGG